MTLTNEQNAAVIQWINSGIGLSEVQIRLREEFGISLTYMDTRFLVDDLKLTLKDADEDQAEKQKPSSISDDTVPHTPADGIPPDEVLPPMGATGSVQVTVDQITKPGTLISGNATFSDGQRAEWYLDQMGRLGLNPDTPGYRPVEKDIMAFQMELQRLARQQGF